MTAVEGRRDVRTLLLVAGSLRSVLSQGPMLQSVPLSRQQPEITVRCGQTQAARAAPKVDRIASAPVSVAACQARHCVTSSDAAVLCHDCKCRFDKYIN